MNVDEALAKVDAGGRQQWKNMLVVSSQALPAAFAILVMEFAGHTPKTFECHRKGPNGTETLVNACFNGSAALCDSIEFRSPYTSVVTDWSLVCDRAAEAHGLQSLFMAGNTVAAPLIGPLADTFGRRRLALIMFGVQAALMAALAGAPNYACFAVLRFLTGFLQVGGIPCFTLASELVGPQYRSRVGLCGSVCFSCGIVTLALSAYLITSWRWLLTMTTFLAGAVVVMIALMVPPSPRWLLQKGRTKEAQRVLLDMARANGVAAPADLQLQAAPRESGQSADTCCTLVRHWRPALWTVVLCFNWAVHTLSYYGLTAAAADMGRGRFSSFAFSGLVELPPVFFIAWLLDRLGRRYTLSGGMAVGGIGCLLIWLLPAVYIDDHGGRLTLSLIGKLCISTTFTVTYIFTGEIFPTSLRNTGFGVVNFCARLAGVVYPFVALLNNVDKDLHFLFFGVLITLAALLNLVLPETVGKTLPKTVDEMMRTGKEMYSPVQFDDTDGDSDSENVVLFKSTPED